MEDDVKERLNNLEFMAQLFRVAPNTLRAWIRQGMPVVQKADKARGVEWKLDSAAILKWRIERAIADATTQTQNTDGKISKSEAERRKAVAHAKLAEFEADEAYRAVVSTEDAKRVTEDFCDSLEEALEAVPGICAERISRMTVPHEIQRLFEAEIYNAYRRARELFRAKCEACA